LCYTLKNKQHPCPLPYLAANHKLLPTQYLVCYKNRVIHYQNENKSDVLRFKLFYNLFTGSLSVIYAVVFCRPMQKVTARNHGFTRQNEKWPTVPTIYILYDIPVGRSGIFWWQHKTLIYYHAVFICHSIPSPRILGPYIILLF